MKSTEEFVKNAKKIHGDKYDYSLVDYTGDCKYKFKLPFDFYLSDYNTCVEFDGIQHFEPRMAFGGKLEFEKTKIRDKIKDDYCKNNGINLIRISNVKEIEDKLKFLCQ